MVSYGSGHRPVIYKYSLMHKGSGCLRGAAIPKTTLFFRQPVFSALTLADPSVPGCSFDPDTSHGASAR